MPNTFFGLTIGTTGLYGANLGINTTAHNITNAETEGYTRQVLNTRADTALKANGTYGMIGTGLSAYSITQVRDDYYDQKFRSNNTISGYYETQNYYMNSLENFFNEIRLEGFNSNYNYFNDALQELSKNPANIATRTQAENYAQNLCDYINSLDQSLSQLQNDTNFEIKSTADRINSYAIQISGLTKQINKLEVTGGKANDLRDQRNLLVDGLSELADISVSERLVGAEEVGVSEYTVRIGDTILVDTFNYNTLTVEPRPEKVNQSDLDGLYELKWKDGTKIEGLHCGGRMQALYEMRDGNSEEYFHGSGTGITGEKSITVTDASINQVNKLHIPEQGVIVIKNREYTYNGFEAKEVVDVDGNKSLEYTFALDEELNRDHEGSDVRIGESISFKGIAYYMQQLDEFTKTFSEKFNDLHKSGYDLDGKKGLDFFNGKDKVSGENYVFERTEDEENRDIVISSRTGEYALPDDSDDKNKGSYYFMTAKNFSVTKEVYGNPRKMVTGSDMVNGTEKSDLVFKYIDLKNDKNMFLQGTPQGFLQSLVAELGVDTHKSANFNQNHKDIVSAIENQRLSVSGVDMDEEAMNLVRYQNSYNLAAKVISTMNEMYDRLINYMGV